MVKKALFIILIVGILFGVLLFIGLLLNLIRNTDNPGIYSSSNEESQTVNQTKSELEFLIENEVKKLRKGRILYNIPENMKVGQVERIEVRIEKTTTDAFTKNLQGDGNYEINDIKVSPLMKVKLTGGDGKFQIVEISDDEQIVIDNYYTQWVWDVTPLKSGHANLSLVVSFKINVPNQVDRYQDYILFDKQINVKVNPLFSLSSFLTNYWQWVFGTIFAPIAGFVVKRFLKREKMSKKRNKKVEKY